MPTSSIRKVAARVRGAAALVSREVDLVGRQREMDRIQELFRDTTVRRNQSTLLIHGPEGIGKQRLCREAIDRIRSGGTRFRVLEGQPFDRDLGYLGSLLSSRFVDELGSSIPVQSLVTTLRMLVPTHEVVEVSFTVARLIGIELPTSHISLESLSQLLEDPARRRPFLADILTRLFKREAERLPLFILLRHPEEADKESQSILSEVLPALSQMPVFVVSLQRDMSFKGAGNSRRFIRARTAPGSSIADLSPGFMGAEEVTRITNMGARGLLDDEDDVSDTTRRGGGVGAQLAQLIDANDGDETLVLDASREALFEAPKIFGLDCELMGLRPLPDMAMESLVRRMLEPVKNLPDALVGMIMTRAEGIPGQLRQHISALVGHGVLEQGLHDSWVVHLDRMRGDALPSDLDELSRSRIRKLPDKHRHILELASIVGPLFRVGDVLSLMRLDEEPGEVPFFEQRTESRLRRVLLDLQGQEFITYERRLGPQGDEAFRFRFERERELLELSVEPARRSLLHRVLAQVLERRGAEPEQIARQWQGGGATRRAALALLRGGVERARTFKIKGALEALEAGIEDLGIDEGIEWFEGLDALAQCLMVIGEFPRVESICQQLAQGSYALGMPYYGARAFLLRAGAARHVGDLDRAAERLEGALSLISRAEGARALATRAEILDELALNRWRHGAHFSEALELSDRALRIREQMGDVANTARTLLNIGRIQLARPMLDEAQACLQRAAQLAESEDLRQVLAKAKNALGVVAMTRGEHRLAQELWAEALDISQSLGDRALRAMVLNNLGDLAITSRNYRLAQELLGRSTELARSIGEHWVAADSLRLISHIALAENRFDEAAQLAKEALEESRRGRVGLQVALALRNLAEVWGQSISRGGSDVDRREREADRHYEEAIALLEAMGSLEDLRETLGSYRAFLIERGRTSESEAVARRLAQHSA